jgi:hypothetical protein
MRALHCYFKGKRWREVKAGISTAPLIDSQAARSLYAPAADIGLE